MHIVLQLFYAGCQHLLTHASILLVSFKTEFEEQKEAGLEHLRRSFTSEQQEKEQSYTDKMSQLTAQLQQLDAVVTQVLDAQLYQFSN